MVSFYSFYPPKPFENPKKETLLDELNFDSSSSDQIPIVFSIFLEYKYGSTDTHVFSSLLFSAPLCSPPFSQNSYPKKEALI